MLKSKEMTFGFTPFNADPVVTKFDLRGLSNVIEPLKKACNWDGKPPKISTPDFPTLDIPTPTLTATSLPSGSSMTIHGISAGDWKIEIDKVIITDSVSSYGQTTKAGGQFALVFLRVTNIGNDPDMFSGFGQVQVRDKEGNLYNDEPVASLQAADTYGIKYGTFIQPKDTAIRLFAFDLPLDNVAYYLVPGSLADKNGQSIILEIQK